MASNQAFPPRTSSRFAPGIYFNFEVGISLTASERPPVRAGVQYASHHMQDRIYRQTHPHHYHQGHAQNSSRATPPPANDYNQTRDYQHDRQRRLGVRPLEQHERSSSAPPSVDRDISVSPLTPEEAHRAVQHTGSFPRETLDRPLPYSPSRFRLGEEDLPWSMPPWYRPPEPECTSPIVPRAPRALRTSPPRTSVIGGIPSIGFESSSRGERERERERERPHRSSSSRGRESRRTEDPQRVKDLGELQQAMMTVDSLHQEPWVRDESAVGYGPGSLGWAVRTEPALDSARPAWRDFDEPYHGGPRIVVGDHSSAVAGGGGIPRSPPPPYPDSQWEALERWMGHHRPRSSG